MNQSIFDREEGKSNILVLMDSIKKKMQSLTNETANGRARAEKWELQVNTVDEKADQFEEQVKILAGLVTNLAQTSMTANNSSKNRHEVCEECSKRSENNDGLEQQVKDAKYTLTESENKYETLAIKAWNF